MVVHNWVDIPQVMKAHLEPTSGWGLYVTACEVREKPVTIQSATNKKTNESARNAGAGSYMLSNQRLYKIYCASYRIELEGITSLVSACVRDVGESDSVH